MSKKEQSASFYYTVHSDHTSLSGHGKELVASAKAVLDNSYSPYSQFKVACAVALNNGELVTGTNQENAAYPSGLCAERVAVFAAMSNFPDAKIVAIAITAKSERVDTSNPVMPCGSCRQVLLEYELRQNSPIHLYLAGDEDKVVEIPSSKSLLPLHFFEEGLQNKGL